MENLDALTKSHILDLKPYQPGKPIETLAREIGMDPLSIAKLASNECPLGPSPKAKRAMRNAMHHMHLYPDGACLDLVDKLAELYKLPKDYFAIGNGSNELIELLGAAYLDEKNGVLMSQYAFVVYKLVARLFNAPCIETPANEELGHDLKTMLKDSKNKNVRLIFICNPNNPTGSMLTLNEIDTFMQKVDKQKIVIIDEAYAEVAIRRNYQSAVSLIDKYPNLMVLRTFSKGYGLAGLRIGYAIAQPDLIKVFNRVRQPFNVNRMAQFAAIAALDDKMFVRKVRTACSVANEQYVDLCRKLNLRHIPTCANFILIQVGEGNKVFELLEKEGLIVRPMGPYGLSEWIRISFGTEEENQRLIQALERILVTL